MTWKNQLPGWAKDLVQARINRDSVWCFPCGLGGRPLVKPVTVYQVAGFDGGHFDVPACRECYARAVSDGINIVSLVPVEQPGHVAFLQELMMGLP